MTRPRAALAALALLCATAPPPTRADEPGTPAPATPDAAVVDPASLAAPVAPARGLRWWDPPLFLGGAAAAFVAHESGHLVANYALGNQPTYERVRYMGTIPFFAIDPGIQCRDRRCTKRDGKPFEAGPRGLFLIESAGIQVQQYTDELILTTNPRLRDADAPFRKGMLAFNTLTSIGYVVSNWAGTEPPNGDLRGLHRDVGAPRNTMNLLVIGVAGLDIVRYFHPEAGWLAWLSRAGKVFTTGVVLSI